MRQTSQRTGRPQRPWPLAALNAGLRVSQRAGIGRVSLDPAGLIAAARRSSGLQDFVDESFREPLGRMLDSIESEADLNPLGRAMLRQILVRLLANRLRLEETRRRNPEIAQIPVEAPVFIVGLQRTGTTLLHRLLACEPALRPLASWEALSPVPVERGRRAGATDPRVRQAEWAERGLRYAAPDFFAIHPVEAHSPEEDVLLLDLSLCSPTVEATQNVPGYASWLESIDHRPIYRTFRRVIQLLLWQRSGRWLGKTPHHLEYLDALLDIFPDARIIQTHRDPARVVASFCSMISHGRGVFSDRVDPVEVGRFWKRKQLRMVERSMAVRDEMSAGSFLDLAYADLVSDPLKSIRRVYEFVGLELAPATEEEMQSWMARNPQHRHGRHRYELEDFGLDRASLDRDFEPYRARFDVAPE